MNATCLACHFQKNVDTARAMAGEAAATAFARELMEAYLRAPEQAASPYFGPIVDRLLRKHCGLRGDRYWEEKQMSNQFILERMDAVRDMVSRQEDPVYAALQFSVLGNYLDFSALRGQVSFEKLEEMMVSALTMDLDRECYSRLCRDLAQGQRLLYLTDNAGEIGFDRILAEEIHKRYPHISITFCVRGGPALNDATRIDAAVVGIPFPVIDNGTCCGGTVLDQLGQQAKSALEQADVVLSKGMGNVETMLGCPYNVYYAFLVKCAHFVRLFDKPMMTPMLVCQQTYEA